VSNDIHMFLFQLFQVYGKITPKDPQERYDAVASMLYKMYEPIDVIYASINDLREIVEMADKPYTLEQLADLGYIVIAGQLVFRSNLR